MGVSAAGPVLRYRKENQGGKEASRCSLDGLLDEVTLVAVASTLPHEELSRSAKWPASSRSQPGATSNGKRIEGVGQTTVSNMGSTTAHWMKPSICLDRIEGCLFEQPSCGQRVVQPG